MNHVQLMAIARHVLGAVGGGLMGAGVGTDAQWADIAGGTLALAALLWSLWDKRRRG